MAARKFNSPPIMGLRLNYQKQSDEYIPTNHGLSLDHPRCN